MINLVFNMLSLQWKSKYIHLYKNDTNSSKERRTNSRFQRAENHGSHQKGHDAHRKGRG